MYYLYAHQASKALAAQIPVVRGQALRGVVMAEPLDAPVDELNLRGGDLVEHALDEADEPREVRGQVDHEDARGIVGVEVLQHRHQLLQRRDGDGLPREAEAALDLQHRLDRLNAAGREDLRPQPLEQPACGWRVGWAAHTRVWCARLHACGGRVAGPSTQGCTAVAHPLSAAEKGR